MIFKNWMKLRFPENLITEEHKQSLIWFRQKLRSCRLSKQKQRQSQKKMKYDLRFLSRSRWTWKNNTKDNKIQLNISLQANVDCFEYKVVRAQSFWLLCVLPVYLAGKLYQAQAIIIASLDGDRPIYYYLGNQVSLIKHQAFTASASRESMCTTYVCTNKTSNLCQPGVAFVPSLVYVDPSDSSANCQHRCPSNNTNSYAHAHTVTHSDLPHFSAGQQGRGGYAELVTESKLTNQCCLLNATVSF